MIEAHVLNDWSDAFIASLVPMFGFWNFFGIPLGTTCWHFISGRWQFDEHARRTFIEGLVQRVFEFLIHEPLQTQPERPLALETMLSRSGTLKVTRPMRWKRRSQVGKSTSHMKREDEGLPPYG